MNHYLASSGASGAAGVADSGPGFLIEREGLMILITRVWLLSP